MTIPDKMKWFSQNLSDVQETKNADVIFMYVIFIYLLPTATIHCIRETVSHFLLFVHKFPSDLAYSYRSEC